MNRRSFLGTAAAGTLGAALGAGKIFAAPLVLTQDRTHVATARGELLFQPHFVQKGVGPHLLDWAYASDENWDAIYTNITAAREGVRISDTMGVRKFGIDVRWNVEGFGYIYITADNGGAFYELPPAGKTLQLNLNFELARSRVLRNRRRLSLLQQGGWKPSREVQGLLGIAESYYEDAAKRQNDAPACARSAQTALLYAMTAGEKLEVERAEYDILQRGYRANFFIGCDARGYFQMDTELFMERFTTLFNYATITHYLKSGYFEDFEPEEGKKQFALRTALFNTLRERQITVEGRPLFWFYHSVTPDWLRNKSFDQVLKYVEEHTRTVVSHYGDGMYAWEVVNEFHDWANEIEVTPEQAVEITRLACEVAKATNSDVHRLINNCCPYAEYVQLKKWGERPARYRQRTPNQFMRDLVSAGVDFTITGQQMYFPYRDLQDITLLVERLQAFGRPVQLTEVGASSGPSKDSVMTGRLGFPEEPYIWHRPWDEELQADWLENLYTLAYSKPWIEAVNWYDFVDPFAFIKNGGLLRSPQGEKKAGFDRLLNLKNQWAALARP
ncbi:MAG TPA: endo-1,4-beta-xylanase [bacterium]|mgnify:CR=1 FL=1|nr:endo-1,4-beta-xylanase [bacterium]HPR88894.1 endo-1,4-beta-xylanase [bacterium]